MAEAKHLGKGQEHMVTQRCYTMFSAWSVVPDGLLDGGSGAIVPVPGAECGGWLCSLQNHSLELRLALGVIWHHSILLVNTARRECLAGLTGRLVGGWA